MRRQSGRTHTDTAQLGFQIENPQLRFRINLNVIVISSIIHYFLVLPCGRKIHPTISEFQSHNY